MASPSHPYCRYVDQLPLDNLHRRYHDEEYGFPLPNDNELFGRLILEINQAGLNWGLILKKKENFRSAFDNFDVQKVAQYGTEDIERLREDASIIRNKLKINAAIHNAQAIAKIQAEYGSFAYWLKTEVVGKDLADCVKLFKKKFKFVGGEIVNEFLMSTGHKQGAHSEDCPVYHRIAEENPPWMTAQH